MTTVFAITTANDALKLEPGKQAEAVFTVTNNTSRPLRGLAKLKTLGETKREWLKLTGESEHDFAAGSTQQFTISFSPPADLQPGKYSFRLDVVSTANPDEDFTEGPTVVVESLPPKPKPPSRAWVIPLALIAALMIVVVIVLILTRAKKVEAPPAKPTLRIVTLGHQDHGKTTLTSAITKVLSKSGGARFVPYEELANPPENNVQGVRLAATQVEYETPQAHYLQIDCRSAADYDKLLNSDGVKLDGAILVVSAADGPMPQTREQIIAAQKKGIKSIAVYVNKVDLVNDAELLQLVDQEILALLARHGFQGENVSVTQGSALMALKEIDDRIGKDSIMELLKAMDKLFVK